jgi:hypothetical protein
MGMVNHAGVASATAVGPDNVARKNGGTGIWSIGPNTTKIPLVPEVRQLSNCIEGGEGVADGDFVFTDFKCNFLNFSPGRPAGRTDLLIFPLAFRRLRQKSEIFDETEP